MLFKVGIGQDSHRLEKGENRPLMLGGIEIPSMLSLQGNSDADTVLHAICNAISSVSGKVIMGPFTDKLCLEQGITDSAVYVKEALKTLQDYKISHIAVSIECLVPKIFPHIKKMRSKIAAILEINDENVGITATSGEGLTLFGQGKGIQAFVIATVMK